jgi:hypothetical protein
MQSFPPLGEELPSDCVQPTYLARDGFSPSRIVELRQVIFAWPPARELAAGEIERSIELTARAEKRRMTSRKSRLNSVDLASASENSINRSATAFTARTSARALGEAFSPRCFRARPGARETVLRRERFYAGYAQGSSTASPSPPQDSTSSSSRGPYASRPRAPRVLTRDAEFGAWWRGVGVRCPHSWFVGRGLCIVRFLGGLRLQLAAGPSTNSRIPGTRELQGFEGVVPRSFDTR